jgi:hypothetical protein
MSTVYLNVCGSPPRSTPRRFSTSFRPSTPQMIPALSHPPTRHRPSSKRSSESPAPQISGRTKWIDLRTYPGPLTWPAWSVWRPPARRGFCPRLLAGGPLTNRAGLARPSHPTRSLWPPAPARQMCSVHYRKAGPSVGQPNPPWGGPWEPTEGSLVSVGSTEG